MSIKSKAKREKKKRMFQAIWQKRRHDEFPHRLCNWSGCKKRSYTFKRCRDHRLHSSLGNALARMAKSGELVRVRRGVYGLAEWYKPGGLYAVRAITE